MMTLLYMLAPAILALWAYRQGLRDGMAKANGVPPAPVATVPRGKPKPSKEQRRWDDILANVEAYDGTDNGQRRVGK